MAYKRAEIKGEEVVGIFHSHPASPYPSRTDRGFMELNPIVWLIMSMPSKGLGACHLADETVENVKIIIEDTR